MTEGKGTFSLYKGKKLVQQGMKSTEFTVAGHPEMEKAYNALLKLNKKSGETKHDFDYEGAKYTLEIN